MTEPGAANDPSPALNGEPVAQAGDGFFVEQKIEDESLPVNQRLSALFMELNIVRVVVVDDRLELVLDAALISHIVTANDMARGSADPFFPTVDMTDDNLSLLEQIDAVLNTFDANRRAELATALTPYSNEAADANVPINLKELMPTDFPILYLTPERWKIQRDDLLSDCTEAARTLFLFDQELGDGEEGTGIISGLAQQDGLAFGTRWFCGLLSHTLNKGEEVAAWRQLSNDKSIALKLFMPISKQNLTDGSAFYGAVYRTVINTYAEKMKDYALNAFGNAMTSALSEFRDLDPIDFEHIVAKSSDDEGVSELETLMRVFAIVQRDLIKKELLDQDRLGSFLQDARTVKKVADVGRALPETVALRLAKLRYKELYEAPELINQFRDPLRNGDLFEIGAEGNLKLWVLIAQPCDLMVRSTGKRAFDKNFKVAVLAPVKRAALGTPPMTKAGYGFELTQLDHDGRQPGSVVFTQAAPVALDVLDLAVLRIDGRCEIKCSDDPLLGFSSIAWDKRAERLQQAFKSISTKIESKRQATNDNEAKEYANLIMPRASPDTSLQKHGIYEKGRFSYAIRRSGRVREPFATSLLTAFSRYLSRDAYEHDFSMIREIDA